MKVLLVGGPCDGDVFDIDGEQTVFYAPEKIPPSTVINGSDQSPRNETYQKHLYRRTDFFFKGDRGISFMRHEELSPAEALQELFRGYRTA